MPCKIQIKNNLTTNVETRSNPGFNMSLANAKKLASEINADYNAPVVEFFSEADAVSRRVDIPNALVDLYYNHELEIEIEEARAAQMDDAVRAGVEYGEDYLFLQQEESQLSVASPETISKVKEVLKKMGVNIESLTEYARKSSTNVSGANAVADLVRGVIAVAEGKEDVALTEEMVHVATAIIEQKNPSLVTEMISKIDRFKIYKQTLEEYKNNKFYQLPNGKPDIRKIKKEAVDRLISELIINQGQDAAQFPELLEEENRSIIRRWWNAITDFFRGMYKSANISIFEETAKQIIEGEIEGEVSDILNETIYAQRQAPYIKEGVEELFNSNPELANQVYEALGFNKSTFDNKGITLSKETNSGWMFIQLNNKKIGRVKFVNNGEKEQLGLSIEINDEYQNKGYGQVVHILMADLAKKDYRSSLYSDYQNSSQEIQLLNSLVKKGYAEKIGDIGKASEKYPDSFVTEERAFRIKTSDEIQQITPQQKQQALQLYSQYLDSVFPNSKVKDVVYHGTNKKFDKFDKRFINQSFENLIFFFKNKINAKNWSDKSELLLKKEDLVKTVLDLRTSEPEANLEDNIFYALTQFGTLRSREEVARKNKEALDKVTPLLEYLNLNIDNLYNLLNSDLEAYRDVVRKAIATSPSSKIIVNNRVVPVLINSENPLVLIEKYDYYLGRESGRKFTRDVADRIEEYDSLIAEDVTEYEDDRIKNRDTQYAVKEPEQIHILANENDVQGFREFVKTRSSGEGIFFQLAEPTKAQKEIQRRIIETRETLRKEDVDPTIDPLTIGDSDASNFYEYKQPDGTYKRVLKRVTDRVKRYYKDKFGEPTFTKEEKAFNEFKRNLGIKYHGFFEEIHYRYFNLDGTRKTTPDARPDIRDRVDAEVYAKIENYYTEMIEARSKGGKNILVFSEARVYDAREKEAGTIDLLIVDEDGTGHIVDWKFMSVGEGQRDVQWYKQEAYGVQLRRYRDILLTNYGVKKVGMNRAVPILFQIKPADKKVEDSKPTLTGINIGSVDTTKIENLTLVPVSEKTESTGFKSLDKFIGELNAILDRISKTKATSDEEREFKRERLNIVREAIRMAQGTMNIKPVIDVVLVMMKEGENLISDYNMIYKDANAQSNEFTNEQLSDFSSDLRDYLAIAKVFGKISDTIGDLIYNKEMDKMGISEEELADRKEMLEDLSKNATQIRKSREQVYEIAGQFADKYMGLRNLVTGLLNPAAVVKGLGSLFRSISEIPLASVQILYKLTENAKVRASADAKDEVQDLMKIREKLASRGGDLRQLVKKIYRKDDKGNFVNKLIYKYSPEFRDGVKNNSLEENRSKQWLKDNIDVEAYLKEADALLEKRVAQIERDYANNEEMKDRLILQERQKWDLRRADFTGWNNYVILRHPKAKWLSEEYKELEKDPELLELYNFISKINEKAKDVGYLSNQGVSTFLPWVRKSMAESLAWDFSLSTVMNFGNKLSIRADDVGYGNIDALTGEVENGIPKYYTTDFTQLPGGEVDTSEVSEDLFANMILYIGHMNNYKYLSEVEDQIKLVKDIETFKEHHLQTSRTGNVVVENGRVIEEKGNEENAKIYDQFMRAVLYDQKYPLDDTDVTISTGVVDYMKKAVNKTAKHFGGKEIFTIDDNPSSVSLVKSMETMNRYFQLKALGFEFVSGAVNWFGTNVQLAAQSGIYFNSGEVLKKQYEILGNNLSKEKQDIFVELIDKFMPLREDPNYESFKKAGMTTLTRQNFGDALMFFMRQPEQFTEKAVFMTLLDNIMVQDGKFVNIRDVVKRKYRDEKKGASVTRLKEIDKEIESEIEQLKKEQSIGSTMKMEDGNLVIPGFDLNNRDEIQRLTRLTRRISTNATGGINAQNVNRAQMNIWMKSAMIFKNWIPGLAFTRFDHLKKVSDDFSVTINEDGTTEGERYDIGRLRLFMYVAGTSIVQLSNNINNILSLNEDGMVELDRMFEKFSEEYLQRTGETLNMTREEFIDLIRTNLRNQMRELALTLSLIGLSFSMGLIGPDDDDTRAEKNAFRYSQRIIDKFVSELTFFINPFEFQNILEGNLLPAIGVVTDVTRFGTHLTKEVTGFDVSDPTKSFEEVKKDAQPIKNLAKMFPLTKSLINYAAMLDEEFAKEYDITVSKTPGK
jgi:hypothetical protein